MIAICPDRCDAMAMLSSHMLASVLESAPDAIVIIDTSGRIMFANRQVSALFGYEAREVIGLPIEHMLPERFRTRHVEHRRRYTDNVRLRPMGIGLDLFARRKNGSEFPVEISLSPVQDEDRMLVAAAIRDVTDRKHVETQLKAARETADRANQAKSRFLATASHDLRQPLQSLALLNGTLRRVVTDSIAAEAVAQQGQAIDAMSRLLNALLDISKLESGAVKPDISDFSVAAIFEEMRTEFASVAASKGLRLEVHASEHCVRSDRSLLGQILRNLISNAIKYTRSGLVRLSCQPRSGTVHIEVTDTGIGIPGDQIAYIYDEFFQVGVSPNTVRDGYGLGLSIVNRLVKLLGLQMEVQSEIGKGSTFALKVPVSDITVQHASQPHAPMRSERCGSAPHVLLVEDDAAVRRATQLLLKVEGYRVTAAGSVAEAVSKARENRDIDVLITDFHLSRGETGLHVISDVRQILGENLGTVLVTGDTSTAMKELRTDARLRLASKPINADELLGMMRDLIPS